MTDTQPTKFCVDCKHVNDTREYLDDGTQCGSLDCRLAKDTNEIDHNDIDVIKSKRLCEDCVHVEGWSKSIRSNPSDPNDYKMYCKRPPFNTKTDLTTGAVTPLDGGLGRPCKDVRSGDCGGNWYEYTDNPMWGGIVKTRDRNPKVNTSAGYVRTEQCHGEWWEEMPKPEPLTFVSVPLTAKTYKHGDIVRPSIFQRIKRWWG